MPQPLSPGRLEPIEKWRPLRPTPHALKSLTPIRCSPQGHDASSICLNLSFSNHVAQFRSILKSAFLATSIDLPACSSFKQQQYSESFQAQITLVRRGLVSERRTAL